jgi:hypothetical protein
MFNLPPGTPALYDETNPVPAELRLKPPYSEIAPSARRASSSRR